MLISVVTVSRALDCHSELVCWGIDFDWFSFELATRELFALLSHGQLVVLLVNLKAHLHVLNAVKVRLVSLLDAAFFFVVNFV